MKHLAIFMLLLCIGCGRIPPGYVGIVVDEYGDNKGVRQDYTLRTGRVWFNPITHSIYQYPTFMQHRAWTQNKVDELWGSNTGEAITFNSKEGATVTADVGINYKIDPEKVPSLFIEFRQDIDTVTNTYFRNQTRDAFNRVGGRYKAVDIFGESKETLLREVQEDLSAKLTEKGFIIDSIGFIGSPRADDRVMSSINSVIESTQRAIEAENKIRQSTAEAKQKIETATGEAKSKLLVAEAEAEANRVVAESITPTLINYELIKRWDGTAPKVLGSETGLLLNLSEE